MTMIDHDTPAISARPAEDEYRRRRREHWEDLSKDVGESGMFARAYQSRVRDVLCHLIPAGQRVLELGCGGGKLLSALQPVVGMGVDFCAGQIKEARANYPEMQFFEQDIHERLPVDRDLDAVVMHDVLNDAWDIQRVLQNVHDVCSNETRVVLTFFSRLWQLPLTLARRFGFARRLLPQNWITYDDAKNLLELSGFEVIRHQTEVLMPFRIPILHFILNIFLVRLWPFSALALSHVIVARKRPAKDRGRDRAPKITVLVPARNEEGNINAIFDRTPHFEGGTEIIFVEGNSTDQTWEAAQRAAAARPHLNIILMQQSGRGKGDAVRTGFARATGDILLILDADLTVAPEDLPRFVTALRDGTAEFVNGVRLVYPMENNAMRPLNFIANKFFSLAFTWLLDQPVKDTLCGTKVLWREDYQKIVANRRYFGDFDPYGDFDLLFGAAKLSLRIVDMPIRYAERTYGTTNINRWTGGVLLLNMTLFAARRLKFV
jgi:SAM-dependent methyltransferase